MDVINYLVINCTILFVVHLYFQRRKLDIQNRDF